MDKGSLLCLRPVWFLFVFPRRHPLSSWLLAAQAEPGGAWFSHPWCGQGLTPCCWPSPSLPHVSAMNPSGPIPCLPVFLLPWLRQSSQRIAVLATAPLQGTHSSPAGLRVPLRASANLGLSVPWECTSPKCTGARHNGLSLYFNGASLGWVWRQLSRGHSPRVLIKLKQMNLALSFFPWSALLLWFLNPCLTCLFLHFSSQNLFGCQWQIFLYLPSKSSGIPSSQLLS